MNDKKRFGSSQQGFIKGKSCLSKLIDYNEVTRLMDKRRAADVVHLVTFSHNNLVEKFAKYGLDKRTMIWTENRLSDKVQRAVINGTKSR